MPTYEYRCSACGHEFEEFQSMTAKPLKACPSCGKKALVRLIGTGAALVFKGSGFYQTDYRSESYKKAAKAESSEGSGKATPTADSGTPAKAEPAPAAKREPASPAKAERTPKKKPKD
ncbi:MAG: zinc ribbon domain-containing protein [Phycisphaeraceae bacterium]|nr:MAG: zinc ribbon domain-containing protein [Phycisphaeraceae bacterium]